MSYMLCDCFNETNSVCCQVLDFFGVDPTKGLTDAQVCVRFSRFVITVNECRKKMHYCE